ncbi:MAG: phospholipase D-like domain-containing protein, partial [Myxococcales bacterium]
MRHFRELQTGPLHGIPRTEEERAREELAAAYLPRRVAKALIPGNALTLLRDGAEAYPRMLAAIAGAQRTVRLETYRLAHDEVGRRFGRALREAAARGVEVTVLYDALGSWGSRGSFFRWLKAGGVKLRAYRPLLPWRWKGLITRRDHRKLLVVDGRKAFVGGINIAEEWHPSDPACPAWRDDVVELEGPAAVSLDGLFRATWRSQVSGWLHHRFRPRRAGQVPVAVLARRRA